MRKVFRVNVLGIPLFIFGTVFPAMHLIGTQLDSNESKEKWSKRANGWEEIGSHWICSVTDHQIVLRRSRATETQCAIHFLWPFEKPGYEVKLRQTGLFHWAVLCLEGGERLWFRLESVCHLIREECSCSKSSFRHSHNRWICCTRIPTWLAPCPSTCIQKR